MSPDFPVRTIAIVGGSGAGKGWLVERLCQLFGDAAGHLQLDDFYRDRSHLPLARRARLNFDLPAAIDWAAAEHVLRACRAGRPATVPRYDFATHCRRAEHVAWSPRPIVLVDGLWLLRPPAIRALFDLRIFLAAPTALRHARRLARDVAVRGYTREAVERQLRTAVAPMHARYVEPQKKWADIVLVQPFARRQLRALADRLWTLARESGALSNVSRERFQARALALLAPSEAPTAEHDAARPDVRDDASGTFPDADRTPMLSESFCGHSLP